MRKYTNLLEVLGPEGITFTGKASHSLFIGFSQATFKLKIEIWVQIHWKVSRSHSKGGKKCGVKNWIRVLTTGMAKKKSK